MGHREHRSCPHPHGSQQRDRDRLPGRAAPDSRHGDAMRPAPWPEQIECWRVQLPNMPATHRGDPFGAFYVRGKALQVIASMACPENGDLFLWDHVSVSLSHRCPTWDEMCWVKDLFFLP